MFPFNVMVFRLKRIFAFLIVSMLVLVAGPLPAAPLTPASPVVPAPIESVYGAAIASHAFSFQETTIRHPGRAVRMGIDDILRLPDERWGEPETGTPNFGYTDSIYWFRTTVRALESASDFLATSFNIRLRVRPDKTTVNFFQGDRLAHAI